MSDFLPKDYEIPVSPSNYTKFEDGTTTKFRILPMDNEWNCIVFWEYFDKTQGENGKPVRSVNKFTATPWIEPWRKTIHKWAFKVWNYDLWQIQICSLGQKWLQEQIMSYINDDDYWNPLNYDIKIKRDWKGLETKYWLTVSPPKPFDEALLKDNDKNIDWFAYLESEEPFIES